MQKIITSIPSKIALFWNILERSMKTIIQHRDAPKASAENFYAAFRGKSTAMDLNMQDVLNGECLILLLKAERIIKLAK